MIITRRERHARRLQVANQSIEDIMAEPTPKEAFADAVNHLRDTIGTAACASYRAMKRFRATRTPSAAHQATAQFATMRTMLRMVNVISYAAPRLAWYRILHMWECEIASRTR